VKSLVILYCCVSQAVFSADVVAKMYLHQVDLVENDVLSLAQAMPADKYNFAPTERNFKGLRTFGEQIKHLATMIYMAAALSIPERSPYGPGTNNNGPDEVRSKDEIIAYLKGSLTYARKAMGMLTEKNHLDPVPTYFGLMPRADVAAGVAYHSFNHYGQIVVYARMNGIVPPMSVPTREVR
jgi:DinB superfamily